MRLKIKGFTDVSALEQADAQFGDLILKYDGKDVHNLNELGEAQAAVNENQVSVELKRGNEFITVQIPSGALGVYLQELQPAHQIKDDEGIVRNLTTDEYEKIMRQHKGQSVVFHLNADVPNAPILPDTPFNVCISLFAVFKRVPDAAFHSFSGVD